METISQHVRLVSTIYQRTKAVPVPGPVPVGHPLRVWWAGAERQPEICMSVGANRKASRLFLDTRIGLTTAKPSKIENKLQSKLEIVNKAERVPANELPNMCVWLAANMRSQIS